MLRDVVFSLLILGALCALEDIGPLEKVYYTRDIIKSEGYPAESHHVTTKDGYILEMHRIPYGKKDDPDNNEKRPVVFLMHGLFGASNSYTYMGPEYSLAYILADAGYDVWMGNARGTKNSRHHVSLDPDKDTAKFFDFSFEEIAIFDLPAMFDYILEETGREKLHYVGHSQGGTVFYILNSMKSDYHEKIASAHLLAGVGYQNHIPDKALKLIAPTIDTIYSVNSELNHVRHILETNGYSWRQSLRLMGGNSKGQRGALLLAKQYEFFPPGSVSFDTSNSSLIGIYAKEMDLVDKTDLIGGAAMKQVIHYGQNVRDKKFRRWDYGALQNIGKYGSVSPPSYNLFKISIDVTLHYSLNDNLLSEADALAMANTIPNCNARKVARESFTHIDYIASKDSKELVLDYIVESFNNYNNKNN